MCSGSHLVGLLTCTLGLGAVFYSPCLLQTDRAVLGVTELNPTTSGHIPESQSCRDTAVSPLLLSGSLCHPGQDTKAPWVEIQSGLISWRWIPCPWGNPSRIHESPQLVSRLCAAQAVLETFYLILPKAPLCSLRPGNSIPIAFWGKICSSDSSTR